MYLVVTTVSALGLIARNYIQSRKFSRNSLQICNIQGVLAGAFQDVPSGLYYEKALDIFGRSEHPRLIKLIYDSMIEFDPLPSYFLQIDISIAEKLAQGCVISSAIFFDLVFDYRNYTIFNLNIANLNPGPVFHAKSYNTALKLPAVSSAYLWSFVDSTISFCAKSFNAALKLPAVSSA